jgi:predicted PurR-regulated permease PerM
MQDKHRPVALFILVLLFGYWSFRIVAPYLQYILLGLLLAFLCYPVYKRMIPRMNASLSAVLIMIAVLLVVILPSIWLTQSLIAQATTTYESLQASGTRLNSSDIAASINAYTGFVSDDLIANALEDARNTLRTAIPHLLSRAGEILIGLALVFIVMYFALKEGRSWIDRLSGWVPIRKSYKVRLQRDIEGATRALFFGQVLVSVLIGILCGSIFAAFGVSNAIFWGFVMMICAFLPLLGAPMVYVPAGIILAINDRWIAAISIVALCTIIVLVMDNIVRPKIVSRQAEIHPLTVIIGAIGGLYLLGFLGFILGPLILNIFMTLLSFDYDA